MSMRLEVLNEEQMSVYLFWVIRNHPHNPRLFLLHIFKDTEIIENHTLFSVVLQITIWFRAFVMTFISISALPRIWIYVHCTATPQLFTYLYPIPGQDLIALASDRHIHAHTSSQPASPIDISVIPLLSHNILIENYAHSACRPEWSTQSVAPKNGINKLYPRHCTMFSLGGFTVSLRNLRIPDR